MLIKKNSLKPLETNDLVLMKVQLVKKEFVVNDVNERIILLFLLYFIFLNITNVKNLI